MLSNESEKSGTPNIGYFTMKRNDPLRVLDIKNLPSKDRKMKIPANSLEYDMPYKFEVLAREESGNKTITVGFFRTIKKPGK